jgi:periplasmic divalent cation tolerance protein
MPTAVMIFCTCGERGEGERIARTLVEERLAACVNIIPGITSIYKWKGAVETSSEYLLLIKTTLERAKAAEDRVVQLHSYDTPELLRTSIQGGLPRYLDWLVSAVSEEAENSHGDHSK